jgi:hypothetical protein
MYSEHSQFFLGRGLFGTIYPWTSRAYYTSLFYLVKGKIKANQN